MEDEEIQKYVNQAFAEQIIRGYEDQLLGVMKVRQEKYPSEINDKEWLDFTNFVCSRRCKNVRDKREAAQQNIDPDYVKMIGGISDDLKGKV